MLHRLPKIIKRASSTVLGFDSCDEIVIIHCSFSACQSLVFIRETEISSVKMRGLFCIGCGGNGITLIYISTSDYISFNSSCASPFPYGTHRFYYIANPEEGRTDASLLTFVGIDGGKDSGPQFTRYGHHSMKCVNSTRNAISLSGASICFEPTTGGLLWFTFRNNSGTSLIFLGLFHTRSASVHHACSDQLY